VICSTSLHDHVSYLSMGNAISILLLPGASEMDTVSPVKASRTCCIVLQEAQCGAASDGSFEAEEGDVMGN
jgi:hypothetical protein